jgi:ankyrin repeat protein
MALRYELMMNEGCVRGDLEKVKHALALSDGKIDLQQPIRLACNHGHLQIVEWLLKTVEHQPSILKDLATVGLQQASLEGHEHLVTYLLSMGADVHDNSDAPLRWALSNGHIGCMKILIEVGADVEKASQMCDNNVLSRPVSIGPPNRVKLEKGVQWLKSYVRKQKILGLTNFIVL